MESLSLLRVEPELAAGLDERQRQAAERGLSVPVMRLGRGAWEPPAEAGAEAIAYLLCEGMLLRRLRIDGGSSVELLGPGDCLFPWRQDAASFSAAEWEVLRRARLAVLDLRPGSSLSRWPAIAASIAGRAIDRSRTMALQAAIMSVVGTEERVRVLLWALAERWGRVGPDGTALDLELRQGVLAELVGARRQTVSQALAVLAERGLVESAEPGQWLLRGEPPESVEPGSA